MHETYLRRVEDQLTASLDTASEAVGDDALVLVDELRRVVASGGKRLRPMFCLAGHAAGGGPADERIAAAGAAIEMLHTFALIQDDLMDGAPIRRGERTIHTALGDAAAILASDVAFVLARRLLESSGFAHAAMERARERWDRMCLRAVGGQWLDLWAAKRRDVSAETAVRIARTKTAAYTVVDPLAIGALLADAGPRLLQTLERYGLPLGEAFQLADDLRGAFEGEGADLRDGKCTLLVAVASESATEVQRRALESGDVAEMRAVLVATGAAERVRDTIASLVGQARAALESVDDHDARRVLSSAADAIG